MDVETQQPDDDFDMLHNFAHDLKAPLNALKGFIELVAASGELNERQTYFNTRAQQALEKMQTTIHELLDFARAESRLKLRMEVCDVLEVIDDNVEMLRVLADEQHISIDIKVDPAEQFVHADPRALGKVLANLVSNAIKYNRIGGSIIITTEGAGDFVQISVADTGLGIKPDELSRVFNKFYRGKHETDQPIEGTGLGLSYVELIVRRHGGEISVESEPGKGSIFRFTLPRARVLNLDHEREHPDSVDDRNQETREEHRDSDSNIQY